MVAPTSKAGTPTEPQCSFVIAVHNCLELTQAMLASLQLTVDLSRHELIFVDDCSEVATRRWLANLPSPTRAIRNEVNLGFARSNNLGAAAALGRTLVFLNSDLEFNPSWLEPMLELLDHQPEAGAVGNVQLNHRTGAIDHAGIFFDLQGMPTHALKTRRRVPQTPWAERNAVTAACLAIRAERFRAAGGFDSRFRNGMEDVALCSRLKQMGFRNFVSHRSIVRHHVSSSPGRHLRNQANTQIFRESWAPFMAPYGRAEWPREYLRRYARYWWRMEPRQAARAIFLLLRGC